MMARHAVRQDLRHSCADRDPVAEPVGVRDALAVETTAGAAATAVQQVTIVRMCPRLRRSCSIGIANTLLLDLTGRAR